MQVRDRMSAPAITIEAMGSIAEARALMSHYEIRRLPVVHKGRLVGIVTQTDLMRALPSPVSTVNNWDVPTLLRKAIARDIMTPNPITIGPDAHIETAAATMSSKKIGGLPVVAEGRLLGVITESDLFDAFVELTGMREGGARLVVDLGNRADAFVKVTTLAHDIGAPLTSIATYRHKGRRLALVRVDTADPLELVQALNGQAFPVLEAVVPAPCACRQSP